MAIIATVTLLPYPNDTDNSQRHEVKFGTMTLAGTYVTGGFTATWNPLTSASFPNSVQTVPLWVDFQSTKGFDYVLNIATGKVQIWVQGTATQLPMVELTNGTAAPVDTIQFRAEYLRD